MRMVGKWLVRRRTYEQQKAIWGFIYVLPWLIGFTLFFLVPLIQSFRYSLSKVESHSSGLQVQFIGLDNFIHALTVHTSFNRTFVESILNMVVNVPLIVIFSLFLAAVLNQKFLGRGFARAIFFLPVILASSAIANIDVSSFVGALTSGSGSDESNALQSFELKKMLLESGISPVFVNYVTGAVDRIYEIISLSGVQILIFLAGLQSISPSLYEASKIEGATGYETFWKVTFPMLSPLILTNTVYSIIDSFTHNSINELISSTAFKLFDFGLSAAMAWVYFAVVAFILATSAWFISRKVFYYD